MSDDNGKDQAPVNFNIVTLRGDPKTATTLSGHQVEKKEFIIMPSPIDGTMISLRCADYHLEHFVYIDPLFEIDLPKESKKKVWFAMCTCGAPAGLIGPSDSNVHEGISMAERIEGRGIMENMLVCQKYFAMLLEHGHGFHQGQDEREWR